MQMHAATSTTPASAELLFYLAKGDPSRRGLYGDWQTGRPDLVVNSSARRCGEALFEAAFRERGWIRTCNGRSSGCTPNRTWVAVVSQELGPIGQQTFGLPDFVLHNADRRLAHRLWNKANFGRAVERRAASAGCSADAIVPRTITDVTSCSAYRAVAAVAGNSSWVVKDPSKGLGNGLLFTTWEKLGPALARACACDQRLVSTSNSSRTACYLAVLRGLASDGLAPPSLQKAMAYLDRTIEDLRRYARDRGAWQQAQRKADALLASPRRSIVVQQMVEPPLLLGGHRCSSRDYILHVRCGENCEWMWLFRGYLMIARDAASSQTAASVATNLLHPTGNAAGQPDSPPRGRRGAPSFRSCATVWHLHLAVSQDAGVAPAGARRRRAVAARGPRRRAAAAPPRSLRVDAVRQRHRLRRGGQREVLEMNTTPQLFCTHQGGGAVRQPDGDAVLAAAEQRQLVGAVVDLLGCLSRATADAVAAGATDSVRCACECAQTTAPNAHGGLADGPNLIYARGCESLVPDPARSCA